MKRAQQDSQALGHEAPTVVLGVRRKNRGYAQQETGSRLEHTVNFRDDTRRISDVFQHLRADDEIKLRGS